MSNSAPAVAARDIHQAFGPPRNRQAILRGVSLSIGQGEAVFLVGPSGSGKTTLLSILGCLLTPDRGSVQILGRETAGLGPRQRTRLRGRTIGFIFQSFNLFPTLSALDNVRLTLTMQGVSLAAATRRAAELLRQVGLGHRVHVRPGQLSTGECQRVAVVRALAAGPAVIFADEPTASLDAESGRAVLELLRDLVRQRGVTLVVVTHDERIFPFADRILRLEDGRLTGERRPGAVAAVSAFDGWEKL